MGTGKSTSLRNLPPQETFIISPNAKDFPWEGAMEDYVAGKNFIQTSDFASVKKYLDQINAKGTHVKYVVIEDITHYMNARMMNNSFIKREDWGKWNEFGADVFSIVIKDFEKFRPDLTIIIIGHTELKENGQVGMLTAGKLLDNSVKIPSYFTYAFHSRVFKTNNKLEYKFQTHNDGVFLAKTPMGCFADDFVDNDLIQIIDRIKEYRSKKRPVTKVAEPTTAVPAPIPAPDPVTP